MPPKNPDPIDFAPAVRSDTFTTVLMMAAALAAITGFGVLFSLWWRTSVSDDYEVLRIASQEFVGGRPIVAGELAETVEFEEERDLLDEADPDESVTVDDPETAADETRAAREAREERQEWIRLRDFLVGVGKVARANEEDDLRERRRFLHAAIPHLESARNAGFPPGRQSEGYRILGESLFKLGRYDDAIVALNAAIDRDPTRRRELLPILAESQLTSLAPLAGGSLATIEDFLSDTTLQPEQRWSGELIRVQALIELKRWRDASDRIKKELQAEPLGELSCRVRRPSFATTC